jgi:hypothetical protein
MDIKIVKVPESIDIDVKFNIDKKFNSNTYYFVVNESFEIEFKINGILQKVVVEKGLESDGDSVPRIGFIYTLFKGISFLPAIVHDSLYLNHKYSKEVSDLLFYKLMLYRGVPKWKAWCIYQGVNLFGERPYNRKR